MELFLPGFDYEEYYERIFNEDRAPIALGF
jgi:hypothetical protein